MPLSMAGLAGSVASAARQTGTTLGVAVAGTSVGSTAGGDPRAFTDAEHVLWWPVAGLGIGVVALALMSTTRWAHATAHRTAELFSRPAASPAGRSA
jgi:hypothetical protein